MSYLERLKDEVPPKPLPEVLTKPTETPSVSSVSTVSGRISEKATAQPAVFEYQLMDQPSVWMVLISRSGTDLDAARRRLEYQFGNRVVKLRER